MLDVYLQAKKFDGWDDNFIEAVFEIAFGENAFQRGFSQEEVLRRLRQFSDDALKFEAVLEAVRRCE